MHLIGMIYDGLTSFAKVNMPDKIFRFSRFEDIACVVKITPRITLKIEVKIIYDLAEIEY